MWVIKIGGSLSGDPVLPQWLDLFARLGGGRSVIVPGGGGFADQARSLQARWGFDDVTAHNMAVLGMVQTGQLLQALSPGLQPARGEAEIRTVLLRGRSAVWLPFELLRDRADETTSWDTSSDTLALMLARRLGADKLVIVKSCPVAAGRSFAELAEAGVLDARFPGMAQGVAFEIELLERAELDRARAMLIGEVPLRA